MSKRPTVERVHVDVRSYDLTFGVVVASSDCRRYTLEVARGDAMTDAAAKLRQMAHDIDPQPVTTNEWRD